MRLGLILFAGWVGCTSGSGGSLLEPEGQDGGRPADNDAGASDAGRPDAAVSGTDASVVDRCPWTDRILATDALTLEGPQLVATEAELTIIWRNGQGIGGVNLSAEAEEHFQVGSAQAEQPRLVLAGRRPRILWVESGPASTLIRDFEFHGPTGLIELGQVGPVQLAAIGGGSSVVTLATVGADGVAYLKTVSVGGIVMSGTSVHLEVPGVRFPRQTQLALAQGTGPTYLAWLGVSGLHVLAGSGGRAWSEVTLQDPDGGSLQPGFQLLLHSSPAGSDGVQVLATSAANQAADLHVWQVVGGTATHNWVQRRAGGRAGFSASAAWVEALGQYVAAWPDFRETFDGSDYGRPRRIFGASFFPSGWLRSDRDVPLSPRMSAVDAIQPSLASLGGDALAVAYLSSNGEVHLATGSFRCLTPVPDLP